MTESQVPKSELVVEQNRRTNYFIRVVTVITAVLVTGLVVASLVLQIRATTILLHATSTGAQRRTARTIISLSVENDCRNRRIVAGMPAPDGTRPCVDQTPVEVYPGGAAS